MQVHCQFLAQNFLSIQCSVCEHCFFSRSMWILLPRSFSTFIASSWYILYGNTFIVSAISNKVLILHVIITKYIIFTLILEINNNQTKNDIFDICTVKNKKIIYTYTCYYTNGLSKSVQFFVVLNKTILEMWIKPEELQV